MYFKSIFSSLLKETVLVFKTLHRGSFCQFRFRWIYYCHSSKSTGKETGKMHLQDRVLKLHNQKYEMPPIVPKAIGGCMTNIEARKRWKVVLASIFKAHFIGFWLSFCMNPPFTLLPLPQRKYFLTVSNSTKYISWSLWSLKPDIFAFEWNSFFPVPLFL